MYPLIAVFLAVLAAYGQSPAGISAPHIHAQAMARNCKGAPDRVYGKSDGVYYACVDGKEVCSNEKGAISQKLISAYDAAIPSRARSAKKAPPKKEAPTEVAPPARVEMARAGVISTVDTLPIATPARPQTPIAEERLKGIAIGADRDEVIQKLGEPYMNISGSVERLTYLLTSKNTAQLVFEKGKLTQLRIVPAK